MSRDLKCPSFRVLLRSTLLAILFLAVCAGIALVAPICRAGSPGTYVGGVLVAGCQGR